MGLEHEQHFHRRGFRLGQDTVPFASRLRSHRKFCMVNSVQECLPGVMLQKKSQIFLENKALPTIKRRRENQDNIRKKLKTVFFNNFLRKKINEILRRKQSRLYFEKFPISFVNDIRKSTNKDIINISLLEIILKKELYNENDLSNYYHNLKVIENKETSENEELKEILNKKYCELFEEYINSKEFNIDEINRLKNNNLEDVYIKRYIYQAKHFMEYFAE